jgi:hypothetical protein
MSLRLRSSYSCGMPPTVSPLGPANQKNSVSKRAGSPRTLCLGRYLTSEETGKDTSLRQDGTLGSKHFFDCDFFLADDDLYGSSSVPSDFCHSNAAPVDDDGPPSHCGLTLALRVGIVFSRMNEM